MEEQIIFMESYPHCNETRMKRKYMYIQSPPPHEILMDTIICNWNSNFESLYFYSLLIIQS